MLRLYRALLHLYPAAYRCEFGEEMSTVFLEAQSNVRAKGALARTAFAALEVMGLLCGAMREHAGALIGSDSGGIFPGRRMAMDSEFKFPRATVILMATILAAVLMGIDKAQTIQNWVDYANPQAGEMQREQFAMLPTMAEVFLAALVAGMIGWAILFALRRSGVHRLSELNPAGRPHAGNRLTN